MSLFKKLLAKITGTNISAGELQDLEAILIEADLGSDVTKKIMDDAKSRKDDNFLDSVKATLTDSLSTKSRDIAFDANTLPPGLDLRNRSCPESVGRRN